MAPSPVAAWWSEFLENQQKLTPDQKERLFNEMLPINEDAQWRYPKPRQMAGQPPGLAGSERMGRIKQKAITWKWWILGSMQILLWIDDRKGARDRQGNAARVRRNAKDEAAELAVARQRGEVLTMS